MRTSRLLLLLSPLFFPAFPCCFSAFLTPSLLMLPLSLSFFFLFFFLFFSHCVFRLLLSWCVIFSWNAIVIMNCNSLGLIVNIAPCRTRDYRVCFFRVLSCVINTFLLFVLSSFLFSLVGFFLRKNRVPERNIYLYTTRNFLNESLLISKFSASILYMFSF